MTRETRARMFDPFYTTKKQGRGFGLAAARGIVRNHGGAIRVYSEEGCGTTIKLLFPSVCATPLSDKESETSHTGSGERILVVDDDEQVRNVAQGILKQFGFRVMSAVDGRDGVECYEANAERIDLVLMDVTMPRMDGIEAFKAIRRLNPEALIVLMSGRGDGMIFNALAGRGVTGFLQKPFSASSVVDEIVTALHPQQASPAGV